MTVDELKFYRGRLNRELAKRREALIPHPIFSFSPSDSFDHLPLRIRQIVSDIASQRDVNPADICSPSRLQDVAHARFAVWAVLHEEGKSLTRIGRWFGRDHTTVLSGLRKHAALHPQHLEAAE